MARRPSSRTFLSPSSRRLVAGLLIATGILLVIGELLRVYVLYEYWRQAGVVGAGPAAGVLLGLAAGAGTSYVGWRVGLGG
ncbi:hypothetical protein [Hymenobacter cheonanensis]|uniref:hypothetical protein n=1 Tax=Hymenobacter sp. CA2-7 TaxID=3063993 RepID=UPI0027123994|nr:hypothetical protein [Hymenobacter sp. CA2-7]MDO7884468.1 hypothetical protein [Hymenobacter sp. CA2-7]